MNYIGIDIGDGESCVCILPASSQIEPRPVAITGRKSFLSAVARDAQGQPLVGMDAVRRDVTQGFSVRFKSRFLIDAHHAHDDMRCFLKGIHSIMEKDGLLDGETRITVGCPAGWNRDVRNQYLEMIRSAGFHAPRLVSESRAAFLYAKHAHTIQMDPSLLEDSALVIDIGSSTLDFAYVVNGRETNVGTFGDVYLGGGAIDEALLQAAVDESARKSEILAVFEAAPEWRSYCLLGARRLKEEYFTRQSKGEKNVRCREMLTLMYDTPLPLQLQANEQLIWRVVNLGIHALNGMSFYRMLEKALAHAYEQTCKRTPRLVLLTGGASRMQFFQELCRKRFPDAHFVLCDEPEFSIAKGLAFSARVDDCIHAFNQAIENYLKEDHIRHAVDSQMDSLIASISQCMADIGFEEAKTHIAGWREGKYAALRDMNVALGPAIMSQLKSESAAQAIATIMKNEMNEVCTALQPQIDEICKRHGVACSQMQLMGTDCLPEDSADTALNIHGDMAFLLTSVQALITGLVAGVMLLIPGGGFVDIVLIALAAAASYIGRDLIGNFTETINLPLLIRKSIPFDRIINERFHSQLQISFQERLFNDSAFRADVSAGIQISLTDYVSRMAQKTEISITAGEDNDN